MAGPLRRALLDTSAVIAGSDDPGRLSLPDEGAVSVITLGELQSGVAVTDGATRRARQARLDRVRAEFLAIPVDAPIAHRFGDLLGWARRQGRSQKATDLLIIATAAALDLPLVTLDRRQADLAAAAGFEVHGAG